MDDQLVAAFSDFNDAAVAIGHCQLDQVSAAAQRLEAARIKFQALFMQSVTAAAIASSK